MATIRLTEAKARAAQEVQKNFSVGIRKTASQMLNEAVASQTTEKTYDIFLSHSKQDADTDADSFEGAKLLLEDLGYTVYVDWIEDPQLDRSNVTKETAETLRKRMNACRSLFYVTSKSSSDSKWMPWECGYFDGKKGKSAILPLTADGSESYNGQEYLGIYPYIATGKSEQDKKMHLWVHLTSDTYVSFGAWLNGAAPTKH